jgi:hypothetical protein
MLFGGNKFHVAAPISAFANANLPEAIPLPRLSAIRKEIEACELLLARLVRSRAA